ncbi:MAG TPA: prephenate dehydratase domain-containing protein [Pyrinomonadaceae bacterium]|nr:prephenate dehydratase domain-containing protein [Pyrinomonadaceae bacterium]
MAAAAEPARRVAFQGERGAYSEEAGIALLGASLRAVPCRTFESLYSAVGEGRADYALAPLENSLVGDVTRSLDLLQESALFIIGEVIIHISHNLIGHDSARLDTVRVVESHPVALAQCERFFEEHPHIRRVVADDTAASVRRIVESGDKTRAAIAGRSAARVYGGKILAEHLEDDAANYTRFVLLAPSAEVTDRADKLSVSTLLPHCAGALQRALAPFARRGIELLRIASRPLKGQPWRYRFFLDFKGSTTDPAVSLALSEIRECAEEVRILGCYPAAPIPIH